MQTATLIMGDGIGPEVVASAVKVIEAVGVKIEWEQFNAGIDAADKYGTPLPNHVVESCLRNKIALKGPITTPIASGFSSVNVALRKQLDLYANVRPAKTLPALNCRYNNVDMIVVRENSEDLYCGIEHTVAPGVAESIKVITEFGSLRIARHAFETARKLNRKRVTAVHKANIMKITDGLFLDCCRRVAADYSDIDYDEMIVDNTCMQMVTKPERFDVIVTENLYGDIISDLASGLVGGLGFTASVNAGDNCRVYEAVHGSAPDIAGKGIANPTAMIRCSAMMLADLGETSAAERIEKAIVKTCEIPHLRTKDIGGCATTNEYTQSIIEHL